MTRQHFSFAAGLALVLGLLGTGCPPSRYASCQTDDECNGRGADAGKLICYNLRCVECHYDSDCSDGRVCASTNVCESLSSRTEEADAGPPAKSLEECAKRCKGDVACGGACRDQFKPAK
jgi:hypothetical protein